MPHALIYHDLVGTSSVDAHGFSGPLAGRYKLTTQDFADHLCAIANTGVRVGLADEDPEAILTFDDGGSSALQAADALARYGWQGHFFVTTGQIGEPGFLHAAEIRELADRGHQVGSHSHTHPTYMGSLDDEQLEQEWRRSRDILTDILGQAPTTAAVPGGFLSRGVLDQAARAGYSLLMTSQPTSRRSQHGTMRVQGRYTIWSGTSPSRAAAYARGDRGARASLWTAWQIKTMPKRLSPAAYERLRRLWAQRMPR